MNVLLTSSSYPRNAQDWRSRFIANMVAALARQSGLSLSVWAPSGDMPRNVSLITSSSDAIWLSGIATEGGIAHLLRTRRVLAISTVFSFLMRLRRAYRRKSFEVVHVNWMQNALPLWGTHTPALITVLGSDFGLLRMPGMRLALRAMLRERRAILAPNAEWMVPVLSRLFGDLAGVRAVPFGIDQAWFDLQRQPRGDGPAHWLSITRITKAKIGDLFSWGEGAFSAHRVLHLFGPMQEQLELPPWVQYHGPTYPAELLSHWFPRATGLVTLSRHDEGRPQVMLEAMAAGLPIIASDLVAHRDFIVDRQTGWIAENADDFHEALVRLEDAQLNACVGKSARDWVLEAVGTWDDCAARYTKLYGELLEAQT